MAENKAAPHSFVKDGVYYFIRRVPNDLRHHYTSKKISYSLRTRSVTVASSRAIRAAQKLDEYWFHLRVNDSDLPGKHLLRMAGNGGLAPSAPLVASTAAVAASVKLSEAVGIYRSMPVEALVDRHRQFGMDLNWILLGVEAVRPGHDLAALEGFETTHDRHLIATGIRLKSEKRGAIVARWYRSFLEGKEIRMDDVHTWIELLRE